MSPLVNDAIDIYRIVSLSREQIVVLQKIPKFWGMNLILLLLFSFPLQILTIKRTRPWYTDVKYSRIR
jgi:hypothetical protein